MRVPRRRSGQLRPAGHRRGCCSRSAPLPDMVLDTLSAHSYASLLMVSGLVTVSRLVGGILFTGPLRESRSVAIHLCGPPGTSDGPPCPCSALLRMGFTEPPGSPRALVRSYRTVSPLPVRFRHRSTGPAIGGLFSVALSCGSPRLASRQHPCPVESRPSSTRSPHRGAAPSRGHPAGSPSSPVCPTTGLDTTR